MGQSSNTPAFWARCLAAGALLFVFSASYFHSSESDFVALQKTQTSAYTNKQWSKVKKSILLAEVCDL
jgi:hypothetical protein